MTNRLHAALDAFPIQGHALGAFLKDKRARLDPAAFGLPLERRRTPGLRREEIAARAHVSATWYTWLEQGRGGAPSSDVLERIAKAMMLTDAEREHLFLLGLGRPPEIRYPETPSVSPRLQRMLDALPESPAIVKSLTWDVLAWNRAAAAALTDYGALLPEQRNIMRLMFAHEQARAAQTDWGSVARYVVGAFRGGVARLGASPRAQALIHELSALSSTFRTLWRDNDVRHYGEGVKTLHSAAGALTMEFSSLSVDGRPDLAVVIFNPATPSDVEKIRTLIKAKARAESQGA